MNTETTFEPAENRWLATCPKMIEPLLHAELLSFGAENIKETVSGVWFEGDLEVVYRAMLWSRCANRILLPLVEGVIKEADDLRELAKTIPWGDHIYGTEELSVKFDGTSREFRHSKYGAQLIMDAIRDWFRERVNRTPTFGKENPALFVYGRVFRNRVLVALDVTGGSLHQRGYRNSGGGAPLKENLAAAILYRSNWPQIAKEGGVLFDPMCGSGTLLIEGMMMAADIAPGYWRKEFGASGWLNHRPGLLTRLQEEMHQRRIDGEANNTAKAFGFDRDELQCARANAGVQRSDLTKLIKIQHRDVMDLSEQLEGVAEKGLLVTNPPYGERMGEMQKMPLLYQQLGSLLSQHFSGWDASIITGNPDLCQSVGIHSHKQYRLYNGAIDSKLLLFKIDEDTVFKGERKAVVSDEELIAFSNRLKKNRQNLSKWARKNNVSCYRIYDADIPQFAVAIDYYTSVDGEGYLHVAEYKPPAKVDSHRALMRLNQVMSVLPELTGVPEERIALKYRQRQKGKNQYEKIDRSTERFLVQEGQGQLWVNLYDYLDTGVFLDHRPLRLQLAEETKGKRLLNLFCYTATASVQAALGGADSSVSVDMSNTYLNWAEDNFRHNRIRLSQHELVKANCLEWLEQKAEEKDKFDVIFCDPPSFSNSTAMDSDFSVQENHGELIDLMMSCLAEGGELYFSNNYRRFVMDDEVLGKYQVKNITKQTIDKDFARKANIHHCFRIQQPES